MTKTILTPFGKVPLTEVKRLMRVAGLGVDRENKSFTILSERCKYWKLNPAEQRLSNERRWFKYSGFLPLRYNNFTIALKAKGNDFAEATSMCELFYFKEDGTPVYLPDYLCELYDLDPDKRHFTYGKIFREYQSLKLTP
jgi:hypothetical protein